MDSKATTMYHEKTLTLHEITDFFHFFRIEKKGDSLHTIGPS